MSLRCSQSGPLGVSDLATLGVWESDFKVVFPKTVLGECRKTENMKFRERS
jgi:hypothetical protein